MLGRELDTKGRQVLEDQWGLFVDGGDCMLGAVAVIIMESVEGGESDWGCGKNGAIDELRGRSWRSSCAWRLHGVAMGDVKEFRERAAAVIWVGEVTGVSAVGNGRLRRRTGYGVWSFFTKVLRGGGM
ncbi:unnamed protein product [Calypogeia fissa]